MHFESRAASTIKPKENRVSELPGVFAGLRGSASDPHGGRCQGLRGCRIGASEPPLAFVPVCTHVCSGQA